MINNVLEFKQYIFRQLGHPNLNVKLEDKQLDDIIADALTSYNYDKNDYVLTFWSGDNLESTLMKYNDDTKNVFVFNHPMVKKLVVAKALQLWSRILGKYNIIIDEDKIINWKHICDEGIRMEKDILG